MVESEAAGNSIEFLPEPSWTRPTVAVVDGGGETSCAAVREICSSSGMHNESMDGDLIDAGEYAGERCISRLQNVERLRDRMIIIRSLS